MKRSASRIRVTLEEIARSAGCSKNTVSLALRDSDRISIELRQKIQSIAAELNYIPNFAARNLRCRRSGLIGLFTHPLYDAVRVGLVNHLLDQLHTAEYRPVFGLNQEQQEPWHQSSWIQTFQELRIEALVLLWTVIDKLPEWSQSIPIILVGYSPKRSLACDCLTLDRQQAGRLGIEHLLSRGHRNIMVCAAHDTDFYEGCLVGLADAQCKPFPMPFEVSYQDFSQARMLGYNIAKSSDAPTAAIFGDAEYAVRFMQGVRDAGKNVPDDIAVVAYDYFPWADVIAVPLTTIEQPIDIMAKTAVGLIRRRLENPELSHTKVILPHTVVVRRSG